MSERKKIYVVDGYGQIYRSYFAFISRPLRDDKGNNVSAVFGFFSMIMMLLREYKPDYLVVALDSRGKTFRHELYSQYKANREKAPEDLHSQVPVIVDFLDAMNISHFSKEGMEADDIIATIARNASLNNIDTVMVTGDKDLLQLVSDNVKALRPPRKGSKEYELCGSDKVKDLFGVCPSQIVDYLTILGDVSDNVPGIDGIGEKGAVSLLSKYNSINDIYNAIADMPLGIQKKLENAKDHIELSKTLIKLKDDLFTLSLKDFDMFSVSCVDWKAAADKFNSINASGLAKSALKNIKDHSLFEEINDDLLNTTNDSTEKGLLEKVEYIDIETDNTDRLIGFSLKSKIKGLYEKGIRANAEFDIEIAAWMLESDTPVFSLDSVCQKYLGHSCDDEHRCICMLYSLLSKKIEEQGLSNVFYNIEMPLVSVIAQMELNGICLDNDKMKETSITLTNECNAIQESIYLLCGKTFNINSPKQLQDVLFSDRKLPVIKKTKSGYSTDSDVLEELLRKTEDPVVPLILRFRILNKLLSTYAQQLPLLADKSTGRIHTTFLQTGTATGRLSSKNPNLQNIPVRTEEGKCIRHCFKAPDCSVLLSADYSQIELVVLAHLSKDKNLCDAFINGEDIHTATASMVFGLMPSLVSPMQRRMAKTINFGIIYGMSAFALAKDLGISRYEAQSFINRYFEQFETVCSYIENIKKKAQKDGYVRTAMGHIRYVPGLTSSSKLVLSGALRAAVNTVIQGSAAEIMKKSMIGISNVLEEENLESKILLQVHDEIILEVPEREIEKVSGIVESCMVNAVKLIVPLRVSIETGKTWGDMH